MPQKKVKEDEVLPSKYDVIIPDRPQSALQKKLDEIKEDVVEENKEATLEKPIQELVPKEDIVKIAESKAQQELKTLISSL